MRKKSDYVLMLALLIGDGLMLVMSFAMAYFIRVHVDPRPYEFESQLLEFTKEIALLVPIMLVILAALGLYKKSVFMGKSRVSEIGKLVLAAVLSVAALIVYDYFMDRNIFPVRVVAVLAAGLSFVFLLIERVVVITVARQIFKRNYGTKRALIIGNQKSTEYLADYISSVPESGYRLAGIVAGRRFIPEDLMKYQFSSLKEALKQTKVDVIFQTDEKSTEYVYRQAINRHLMYYFVPSEAALSSHFGELELIGNTPAVMVKLTPLSGGGAIVKRALDVVLSCIGLVFAAIPMLITWVVLKISEPGAPAIYKDERLTQYNRKFKCYKFRSMKPEYSGMTPEQAFIKMGKPELIKKYRKNGDFLKDDPRITKFGRFIRRMSIDELPQIFNILKGDISLIGPRALLPGELRDYGDRSLILSVKSGLTGFAQVSGRRDISFAERRALDIYYVMNWSLILDAQIFLKTIVAVFRGEGAK
ncbi:sugar transferase [Candidatus Saccharibacteria bacterium]|nr:sugar transferase [Candidatus Saccharibacteria bacterium]MBQ6375701.1 sugar transferase [Candidatus Saccharibacteria bacterium]